MKKILALCLALMLLAGLCACNAESPEATQPNPTVGGSDNATEPEKTPQVQAEEKFSFTLQGVELVPGAVFDSSVLPEAASQFEVPSCAIEGTDTVYNYSTVEVTVFDDGTTPVIYSIFLVDPNTSTTEGLFLGDDIATAESIYGTDYTENGTELIYQKGNTQLRLLTNSGFISSIEWRMVTQ